MNIKEYVVAALRAKAYRKRHWMLSAFAITKETVTPTDAQIYPYRLSQEPDGIFYYDEQKSKQRIQGVEPGAPLLRVDDELTVGPDVCISLTAPTRTTIGTLLYNLIALVEPFGANIPYINDTIDISKIESIIVKALESNPPPDVIPDPTKIYIFNLNLFIDSIEYLNGFSQLFTWSGTAKTISRPPGIDEFKAKLMEKYKDSLDDPNTFAIIYSELKKYMIEYLKDDPAYGKLVQGKVLDVAFMKMFGAIGIDSTIGGAANAPVYTSLAQGIDLKDHHAFTSLLNSARAASYSRGKLTALSGVLYKLIVAALNVVRIQADDCGTTKGLLKYISPINTGVLVGRDGKINGKWVPLTKEMLVSLNGKLVEVRSMKYCKVDKPNYCKACAGKTLAARELNVMLAGTNISSSIQQSFLKAMHGKAVSTIVIDANVSIL